VPPAFFASPGSSESRLIPRLLRVLVVDDEPDTVVSLTAILRDEGYDAKGVVDPRKTLEEVEAFDPDVVIVDLAMPIVSGWDVAREIRKTRPTRPVLIAVSGTYVKPSEIAISRAAGFSHFLPKPCDPNFLVNILAAMPSTYGK